MVVCSSMVTCFDGCEIGIYNSYLLIVGGYLIAINIWPDVFLHLLFPTFQLSRMNDALLSIGLLSIFLSKTCLLMTKSAIRDLLQTFETGELLWGLILVTIAAVDHEARLEALFFGICMLFAICLIRLCKEVQQVVLKESSSWQVHDKSQTPVWMHEPYLESGYRPVMENGKAIFSSIFRVHNETGNIWTHMIGAIGFVLISLRFCLQDEMKLMDKMMLMFFFFCVICTCSFSTLLHLLTCHSEKVSQMAARLDYAGITLSISGGVICFEYFALYCQSDLKLPYIISTTIVGIICLVFQTKEIGEAGRKTRAATFLLFGLCVLIPLGHGLSLGLDFMDSKSTTYLVCMAIFYFAAIFFYVSHIPEVWYPKRYDFWFNSHQYLHVCTLFAAYFEYLTFYQMAFYQNSICE